jgi:hypothetical protein
MKPRTLINSTTAWLLASVVITIIAPRWAQATTPLQGRITLRPLTPGDITAYQLPPGTELSGGLQTVGVGQPVYLEAEVNIAIPASDIVGVAWVLTNRPIGSLAALANDPLGTNVPVFEPSDQLVYQAAGRALLRPDLAGQYTVVATITTASEGTTNLTLTITAGTYMGANTCALCHSGGVAASNKVTPWSQTAHASIFAKGIDGILGPGVPYSKSCLQCHTVGYHASTNAVDGGFNAVAAQLGWTFPTLITNGNWAAMPPALQNLANVQCENCHGPGSQHAYSLGNTNLISVSLGSGDCSQCHDAPAQYSKTAEWYHSAHAVTTRDPTGPGREGCVICHTSAGFIARVSGATTTNTDYSAIGCQTCHEPHGVTVPTNNPHLLRTLAAVTLNDGTTVTNAGEAALCMNCHQSRQNATNYVETASGSPYFGPHEGPQADMLMGVNGVTYGLTIPSSAHRDAVTNLCVTCHMQKIDPADPLFLHGGGHTFRVMCDPDNLDLSGACAHCHGPITTFDLPREDYNGDGIIEGVQTEVQHLLDQLAQLLPPVGQAKSDLAIDSTWNRPQLRAGYNYRFVQKDRSRGVHNTAYAVGLLKASIADLTGNPGSTGLLSPADLAFYSWQVQYFGSASNPDAAPNATPAGDGIANWLKYSLGINPLIPGTTNGFGGIVWADGTSLGGNGSTNTVQIYTAAEVTFNTEVGKTYQVQAASSLSSGWQNVSAQIAGTGAAVSYLTPTRKNVQQFFRVVHNP